MSEDSFFDIVQREIGLITVFITSSLIVIICAHEELIRPNEAPFIKQPYRSCLENPLIVVNAVTVLPRATIN
jgi:hypothetical protein